MYVYIKSQVKIIEIAHTHVYTEIIILLAITRDTRLMSFIRIFYILYIYSNNVNTNVVSAVFLERPTVYIHNKIRLLWCCIAVCI